MIKADEIRKINPKEYKYLTKDLDGVYVWNHRPEEDATGWAHAEREGCAGYLLGNVEVEEFKDKDWQDCLIEFEPDYSDMIGCVGYFWDSDIKYKNLGILIGIDKNNTKYKYLRCSGSGYKNFSPVKPEDLKFYNEK